MASLLLSYFCRSRKYSCSTLCVSAKFPPVCYSLRCECLCAFIISCTVAFFFFCFHSAALILTHHYHKLSFFAFSLTVVAFSLFASVCVFFSDVFRTKFSGRSLFRITMVKSIYHIAAHIKYFILYNNSSRQITNKIDVIHLMKIKVNNSYANDDST